MSETSTTTPDVESKVETDRQILQDARARGPIATLGAFIKLSGPGWLQAAITLGGGSLAGSLFLGVLAGVSLMWLQPLAMIMGVIMLSAIGYVVLSTGERPFRVINKHVNPVLGWGWLIATMMANMVWCMPQFSLGRAALEQNLGLGAVAGENTEVVAISILGVLAFFIVWSYKTGGASVRIFEWIVKVMVALIVLSFFGVVAVMSFQGTLDWNTIATGFIPDLSLLTEPAPSIRDTVAATGEYSDYWSNYIVREQRDVMITAAATAVGINMTFLLPYSMLARGWNKDFRGMAIFDLATGLFIPFIIVTSCVVIASASQFHDTPAPGLVNDDPDAVEEVHAGDAILGRYHGLLDARLAEEHGEEAIAGMSDEEKEAARDELSEDEKYMAAVLVNRDSLDLAPALEPLTGSVIAHYVFGIGVVGVALSTIIILMLINGFVFCELVNRPNNIWVHRFGAMVALAVGIYGAMELWGEQAQFWLAVPTSVFGMALAPIAYLAFFLLMNNRNVLGDYMPTGFRRLWWNTLMLIALGLATVGASWAIWGRQGYLPNTEGMLTEQGIQIRWAAIGLVVFLVLLGAFIHVVRKAMAKPEPEPGLD